MFRLGQKLKDMINPLNWSNYNINQVNEIRFLMMQ